MSSAYPDLEVYLAAPFEKREEALAIKAELEKHHVRVISTWLTPDDNQSMNALEGHRNKHDECRKRALIDIAEIQRCNVFILLKPKAWHRQPTTGGHHGETVGAIVMGKPVIIYGDRENVFHYHPLVRTVASMAELLAELHM